MTDEDPGRTRKRSVSVGGHPTSVSLEDEFWLAFREIGEPIRVLMLGSPPDLQREDVTHALAQTEGVAAVHHVHLWEIDESRHSVEAHIVDEAREGCPPTAARITAMLQDRFGIAHSTLQPELPGNGCPDARM